MLPSARVGPQVKDHMTMKLAILGNSHTAALLHEARVNTSLTAGFDVTFFASIGRTMENFSVQDGQLVPQTDVLRKSLKITSGGADRFDPALFDQILLVGLGFNLPPVDNRLSQAVKAAILRNCVESSVAWKLSGMVRSISAAPVLVGHTPLRAPDVTASLEPILQNCVAYDDIIAQVQMLWDRLDVQVVHQPETTRYRDVLTKRSFSRGSRGLRGTGMEHGDTDRSHMNNDYGAIYWQHLRARLSKPVPLKSAPGAQFLSVG